jgi:hypothetical protein
MLPNVHQDQRSGKLVNRWSSNFQSAEKVKKEPKKPKT